MFGEIRLRQEDFELMLIEKRDDGVAIITLNRPERHNAVAGPMHGELAALPKILQQDDEIRAAVMALPGSRGQAWFGRSGVRWRVPSLIPGRSPSGRGAKCGLSNRGLPRRC